MYEFTTENINIIAQTAYDGKQAYFFNAEADGRIKDFIGTVKPDKKYEVTVKEWRPKRSLSANAYLWVICSEIAGVIRSTREEVYRRILRDLAMTDKSICDYVAIPTKAVDQFTASFEGSGIGNFVETVEDCKLDGCTKLLCHYGSSTFDSQQFSRLLDEAINEAHELGIVTKSDEEINRLVEEWEREHG